MRKIALFASPILLLAACSSDPVTPAPIVIQQPAPAVVTVPAPAPVVTAPAAGTPVVVTNALRPGQGRIESITTMSSAAAGGTASSAPMSRIAIRMDDGTVQYVDTPAIGLSIGKRVELLGDGTMRH